MTELSAQENPWWYFYWEPRVEVRKPHGKGLRGGRGASPLPKGRCVTLPESVTFSLTRVLLLYFTYFAFIKAFSLSLNLFFFFSGPRPQHVEVPRLGVESELQLPACTTATAMPDPSCICDLHRSSWQHRILNPLSRARDRTCILMDTSQVLHPLSHSGNS